MRSDQELLLARLRFRHLQLISEVERQGTLGKAALALNLSQPALSKALKEIESLLGFPIFDRSARGLRATAQGAIVTRGAALLLKELDHFHAEAKAAGPAGRVAAILRVGAPAYLAVSFLPAVVARLAAAHPPVAIRLNEANVPRLFEALLGGDLDALVTVYNPESMATTAGQGIRFEMIEDEEYVVIAPKTHRLARARNVSWDSLVNEPWVLTRKPTMARVFTDDAFRRHGLQPAAPVCEPDSSLTSVRMVEEGVGLSTTPLSSAQEAIRAGRIQRVKLKVPLPSATLGLVYRTAAAGHPRIDMLRKALLQLPGIRLK